MLTDAEIREMVELGAANATSGAADRPPGPFVFFSGRLSGKGSSADKTTFTKEITKNTMSCAEIIFFIAYCILDGFCRLDWIGLRYVNPPYKPSPSAHGAFWEK